MIIIANAPRFVNGQSGDEIFKGVNKLDIIISGDAKEIAALTVCLQERAVSMDVVTEELAKRLREAAGGTSQA